jgi:hypothetical protein
MTPWFLVRSTPLKYSYDFTYFIAIFSQNISSSWGNTSAWSSEKIYCCLTFPGINSGHSMHGVVPILLFLAQTWLQQFQRDEILWYLK